MKLYDTKYKAVTSWNKRKRARAKFDDGEGDTCTISMYDGLLYCSCGRALKMGWNIDNIQDKCPDCGRKIEVPKNRSEIPVIETKCLDTIGYKVTADGRVLSGIKFLKPAMGRSGHPVVTMTIDGKQTKQVIKYIVAKAFLDNPEDEDVEYVINLNGNVWDNRVENLRWVTAEEYTNIDNGLTLNKVKEELLHRAELIKEDNPELYERVMEK